MRRYPGAYRGQASVFVTLGLTVLCGMLALAVDVGVTTARDQALRHDANMAAYAGAYALYGDHIGANPALTDTAVWNALASTLAGVGLTVRNAPGTPVPTDPCAAGYQPNQVALTATYLGPSDTVITTTGTSPWTVGSGLGGGSIPAVAYGVQVSLGECQPAGFGGVLGHPTYTIWADGSAGLPLPGPNNTPTPMPTTTSNPVADAPFAISGAPAGDCGGNPATNRIPSGAQGDSAQFYCAGAYAIGSAITFYANGRGLGNDYGHDANFKGYTGGSYNFGEQHWYAGGGDAAPSSCPSQWRIPIISGVHHTGNADYFVVLEYVVVTVTSCGDPSTGTIASVYDPYGYGVVSLPATPTPSPTATTTPMPTTTPTPLPTATPIPIAFRAAATVGSAGHVNGLTIAVPAGTQPNDVLIAQLVVNSDPFAITVPAGWTQIRQDNYPASGITQVVYYHVAGASEPAGYTWSWAPGVNAAGAMGAYSGVNTAMPVMASSGDASQSATGSETAPGLTTTANNARLLGLFSSESPTTLTLPSGETPRWTAQAPNLTLTSGGEVPATAGPTGGRTATAGTQEHMIGQLVALNPLPPPATPTPTLTPPPTSTPTATPTSPATPTIAPTPLPTATAARPVIHHP